MNYRKFLSVLSLAACCAIVLPSCVKDKGDEDVKEYVKVGDAVPSFSVKAGNTVNFTKVDFVNKRSIIVLFTAECPHCKTLMPIVDDAWREIDGNDYYQIVPIARESSQSAVAGLWNANGMAMPFFLDPDRSAYNKFASRNVPRLYSVNEQGVIDWMQTGEAGITKKFLLEDVLGYTGY